MTSNEFKEYMGKSESTHLAVLKMLMGTMPVAVWYTNLDAEVIYVSEAWEAVTHTASEDVMGRGYRQLVHPDDLPGIEEAMRRCLGDEPDFQYEVEFRMLGDDGVYRWMYSKAVKMAQHNGYTSGLVGITVDVNARHASTAEANMLWRAVDAAYNPIVITAHHPGAQERNPIIYVNPAFEKLTGYKLDELRHKDPRVLHDDDDDQQALREIREAISGEKAITGVYVRNYKKNGEMYIAELNLSPIYSGSELTHWVGIQNLATEQVRSREIAELREAIGQLMQTTKLPGRKE